VREVLLRGLLHDLDGHRVLWVLRRNVTERHPRHRLRDDLRRPFGITRACCQARDYQETHE
jgi:hypothetical protein